MTAEELRSATQRLVEQDDPELLLEFVSAQDWTAVEIESVDSVLQLIGMYGYSGRTNRYEAAVRRILERTTRVSLSTYVLLGLNAEAKKLISEDENLVHQVTENGENLLHLAAERGNFEMAETLCQSNIEINAEDSRGEPPIFRAMHAGPWKNDRAMDIAKLLLEHGARVDLWTLAAIGDETRVEANLERYPSKIDELDSSGASALYHACHNNRLPVVRKLLELGANPNFANADEDTPLATACLHTQSQECDLEIIRLLIRFGAEPTLESGVVLDDVDWIRSHLSDGERRSKLDLDSAFATAIHAWHPDSLKQLIVHGRKPTDAEWSHIERIAREDEGLLAELKSL